MTTFSADWLQLREPFDLRARASTSGPLGVAGHLLPWRARITDAPLAVFDLACGHGANLRALAPGLGGWQRWQLFDHDPALLAAVAPALAQWALRQGYRCRFDDGAGGLQAIDITGPDFHVEVLRQQVDLARDLQSLDFGASPLVTASALLDLVSAPWLQSLLRKSLAARAALLFSLNVDGRTVWQPADADDDRVHALFSQHQRRDKGFLGPALGPAAVAAATQQLAGAGYEALQGHSDWDIDGAQSPEMLLAMVDGMAAAALEQDPTQAAAVSAWRARRRAAAGHGRLRVGHVDIVATPDHGAARRSRSHR